MIFKVKISHLIWIAVMLLAAPHLSVADTSNAQQITEGAESFGVRLFAELAKQHPMKNIVFSPFSIEACIGMARMGARNETALEIDQGLALSSQKAEDLADYYEAKLGKYQNSSVLKIANKIYAKKGVSVQDRFNELVTEKFHSSVDFLDFADNVESARTINTWVEEKTNHLIKDLVNPGVLDASTRLVLVNAIYFKGNWAKQFSAHGTRDEDFYLDETRKTTVEMMHVKGEFKYAELDELDATALEMPYKDSDLAMLVILPNKRSGLVELENKLKNTSLAAITKAMYSTRVNVGMPKFKAEFQADLTQPLSKMGMERMFSEKADFGNMLKSGEGLKISSIIHKAFIEVNERGTEAAAATAMLTRTKRALADFTESKEFIVEHPFVFKILQKSPVEASTPASGLVLFEGQIENIDQHFSSTKTNFDEVKDEL